MAHLFYSTQFGNDSSCLQPATSQKIFDQTQFLEETQISKSHVTTLNQEHCHWRFLVSPLFLLFYRNWWI